MAHGVNGAAAGWPRKATSHARLRRKSKVASMGPRPDGRGRLQAAPASSPPVRASMGPRPDGRGRLDIRRLCRLYDGASMGPRPDGRGRPSSLSSPSSVTGVNGAAAGWPRKGCPTSAESSGASSVNGAAAGWPRKALWTRIRPTISPASMGPRPDGRGRRPALAPSFSGCRRQWGRGRMAAEGAAQRGGPVHVHQRQWGRGRMAAEGDARHGLGARPAQASMGPRPDGRGRKPGCGSGRAGVPCVNGAAAGWPRKAVHVPAVSVFMGGVNGAAAGWPRKARSRAGRRRRWCRVNGAAAGWPRKACACPCRTWWLPRVNGAAAGWPRKGAGPLAWAKRCMARQWGRGRMAAEGP